MTTIAVMKSEGGSGKGGWTGKVGVMIMMMIVVGER